MAKKIESSQSAVFTRPALLEGSPEGKMPVAAGKWVWPGAAVALALGTAWGANHIEDQVHLAAPQILAAAGIEATGLDFKTNYRTVDVDGIVSANHSRSHVETILANYDGETGVNIRKANVVTFAEPEPAVGTKAVAPRPPADVRVRAVVNDEALTLSGTVPSQEYVDILYNASQLSSLGLNVVNKLEVSGAPAKNKDTAESINDLALILANFDSNIIDAHIDIDNDLLTGNITTASTDATDKVKGYLPTQMIGIITDDDLPQSSVITEQVVAEAEIPIQEVQEVQEVPEIQRPGLQWPEETWVVQEPPEQVWEEQTNTPALHEITAPASFKEDQITLLQSEINQLENEIRDRVIFAPGSDELTTTAAVVLDDIINALHTYPDTSLEVNGHTDSQSSTTYNLALSHKRAEAVTAYIASRGIESNRLIAAGFGESHPIATNNTKAGRALNRRVEFRAY